VYIYTIWNCMTNIRVSGGEVISIEYFRRFDPWVRS